MYYETLDDEIMEAEKSHDLLSTSWRSRKASGIIQSESRGLRTGGANVLNPSLRAEKMRQDDPA